jgi:late competence protein required for DNA uptake (superfamily II DNA/RNA helicase)
VTHPRSQGTLQGALVNPDHVPEEFKRKVRSLLDEVDEYLRKPRCARCGGLREEKTKGCKVCYMRHYMRTYKKRRGSETPAPRR